MVYDADTLKTTLFNSWDLTGRLARDGTKDTPRPIKFFAHDQQQSEIYDKAVEVILQSPLNKEYKGEFFERQEQNFLIRIRYHRQGNNKADWDISESDVQLMEQKIMTILQTVYDPWVGNGTYWSANFLWSNVDKLDGPDPMLVRELNIILGKIVSRINSGFFSFRRGVLFQNAGSQGDNPPGANYSYTEVFDVDDMESFGDKELAVTGDFGDGKGVPLHYATRFQGMWTGSMYLKTNDIGNTTDKVNQIYRRMNNGEHPEVIFVSTYKNNAGQTYTKTQTLILLEKHTKFPTTDLVVVRLVGKIIKPSVETVV